MADPILDTITILVVDDYPIWRRGIISILETEPDFEVLGEVDNGETALKVARELFPDIILLDVNLPDINGIQIAIRLREERNPALIIMLTGYDDLTQAFHAMRVGCNAYEAKDVAPDVLVTHIRQVWEGKFIIKGQVFTAHALDDWLNTQSALLVESQVGQDHFAMLSPREMQILEKIAYGLSNHQIADELGIGYQTVKNHVSSILAKLGVQDRVQAAVYAIQLGWVRLEK